MLGAGFYQKTLLSGPSKIQVCIFGLAALLKTILAGLSSPQTTSAWLHLVYEYYVGERRALNLLCVVYQYQTTLSSSDVHLKLLY